MTKNKIPSLNLSKAEKTLEALKALSNSQRYKIYKIILDSFRLKKEVNLSDINRELAKSGAAMANKNCIEHIRIMENVGLLKLTKVKYSRGQKIMVEPTAFSFSMVDFLNNIDRLFMK